MSGDNRPHEVDVVGRQPVTLAHVRPDAFEGRARGKGLHPGPFAAALAGAAPLRENACDLLAVMHADAESAQSITVDEIATMQIAILCASLGILLEHQGVGIDRVIEVMALIERGRTYYHEPLATTFRELR